MFVYWKNVTICFIEVMYVFSAFLGIGNIFFMSVYLYYGFIRYSYIPTNCVHCMLCIWTASLK